jgi:single-stranded-DNA-specific exonuclease
MGGAEDAVRLLLAKDAGEAGRLMERVEELNGQRREIQRALGRRLPPPGEDPFDLVVEPDAHKGVIGIVAGQRMRATGRPAGVGTVVDGVAHCSLRAPDGFDLRPLLERAAPFLTSGGGHRGAAGITFSLSRLGFVRETLGRGAREQAEAAPALAFPVDALGTGAAPSRQDLELLEPFGQGFPDPVLLVRGCLQAPARTFGEGHRRFRLQGEDEEFTLFAGEGEAPSLEGPLTLAVSPLDNPRWGRSWRVESFLASQETP